MQGNTGEKVEQGRRSILKLMLSGGVLGIFVAIVYPIIAYLKPPKQREVEVSSVKVGKVDEIEKGSGQIVKFGSKPVILIRTEEGNLRAFSATCTHLDCTVQYRKDLKTIWCACHNGVYDQNGRNISGPPPRPLDEYRVVVQAEEVFISKKI